MGSILLKLKSQTNLDSFLRIVRKRPSLKAALTDLEFSISIVTCFPMHAKISKY